MRILVGTLSFLMWLPQLANAADTSISSAEIAQMGAKCRARDLNGAATREWQERYCSCMEREVPRGLTVTEFNALKNPEAFAEAKARGDQVDDGKLRSLIAQCVKEAGPVQ